MKVKQIQFLCWARWCQNVAEVEGLCGQASAGRLSYINSCAVMDKGANQVDVLSNDDGREKHHEKVPNLMLDEI